MRASSNPVFSRLSKDRSRAGAGVGGYGAGPQGQVGMGYAAGAGAGYQAGAYQQGAYGAPGGLGMPAAGTDERPMTIDDVVTKTAITLAIIVVGAVISFGFTVSVPRLAFPLLVIGGVGSLIMVLLAGFFGKMRSAPMTLAYAVFEGLFVGAASFVLTAVSVGKGANAGAMIFQAVAATLGVFAGMLFVYKTGAIRVTPRFTRMIVAGIFGVAVLAMGNLLLAVFGIADLGLRSGGPIAIIFSLVCIGLAAFSFLIDFDAADRMVREGAPASYSWGIALGLAVTLVWLYIEILRLLSYLRD